MQFIVKKKEKNIIITILNNPVEMIIAFVFHELNILYKYLRSDDQTWCFVSLCVTIEGDRAQ